MVTSLIRGKYVICKITGSTSAEVIPDGAIFQHDGQIIEVGSYHDLRSQHTGVEVIGSANHVVMPGLVNSHFHVGLTPFQLGSMDLPLELWMADKMGARGLSFSAYWLKSKPPPSRDRSPRGNRASGIPPASYRNR